MKSLLFVCIFFARFLIADMLALYLTWYGDPMTTMTIQWHTPIEEKGDTIILEEKTIAGSHLEIGARLVHKVFLENLAPDTEYSFRIGSDPVLYKFRTAPKVLKQPLRFCIGGDLYHEKSLFRKMCKVVRDRAPLFAVLGGDLAYAINNNPFKLRLTAMNQWFSFLQEWKEEMISPEGQVIPFLVVAGNHDIDFNNADLFFDLFAFPEKRLYRAMDFGDYLSLILLDTDHYEKIEGAQTKWLEGALSERSKIPYRFAVYHIGAYPSHYSFNNEISQKVRTNWCPLFDKYDLPAAFENHSHTFKRTFPIRANKIDPSGVVYLGDGCWGALPRKTYDRWYLEKRKKKNNIYMIEIDEERAKIEAVGLYEEHIDSLEFLSRKKIRL